MFCDKLNTVITALNCTSADIAKFADCDPSNISRMRTGSRIPHPDSRSLKRLVNGIYSCAENDYSLEILCKLCEIGDNEAEENIKRKLSEWLFSEQDIKAAEASIRKRGGKTKARSDGGALLFGERLSSVMKLLDLSNVRLSRQLNVDASHISRFRNGLRTPKSNKHLLYSLSAALLDRTLELQKVCELSLYMNVEQSVFCDREKAISSLSCWLVDRQNSKYISAVDNLLESLDNICNGTAIPLPSLTNIAERTNDNQRKVYWNTEGLRSAVTRFLLSVTKEKAHEIWLYSDQNMNWLTQDRKFFLKWLSLMEECVRNGTRIKIIHNIDRDIGEMTEAIRSWLPLYMSGMIEPYYCYRKADARFSHTMFICPDSEAIFASNVTGTEEFGRYDYLTDKKSLSVLSKEFTQLLSSCDLLVKIYTERFLKELLLQTCTGCGELYFYCACKGNNDSQNEIIKYTEKNINFHVFSVSNASYSNIGIVLGEHISAVIKLNKPQLAFVFRSPMMYQALEDYIKTLDTRNMNNTDKEK